MSSTKDYRKYLHHILEAITPIFSYTDGYTNESFRDDRKTQDAVIREPYGINRGFCVRCIRDN